MFKAIVLAVVFGALAVHHVFEAFHMVRLAQAEYRKDQEDYVEKDH